MKNVRLQTRDQTTKPFDEERLRNAKHHVAISVSMEADFHITCVETLPYFVFNVTAQLQRLQGNVFFFEVAFSNDIHKAFLTW